MQGVRAGPLAPPYPADMVHVGAGDPQVCLRPSPWLNPFCFAGLPQDESLAMFAAYADSRADLPEWLAPLGGKSLWAESEASTAHAQILVYLVKPTLSQAASTKNMTGIIINRRLAISPIIFRQVITSFVLSRTTPSRSFHPEVKATVLCGWIAAALRCLTGTFFAWGTP